MGYVAGELRLILLFVVAFEAVLAPPVLQQAVVAVVDPQNAADLLVRGSYIGEQRIDYDYEEHLNSTQHHHVEDEEGEDSEIDQGDSEVSEERCVVCLLL
ncbi:unnamed protein product [Strongylus vulgaris]|uniref:Secreted protein n=1 Tax=Strongylus vulgaris TaxID=40348 RepID=A0A3P7J5S1_STRVU|nr:unnamed protein product [Strongylus vulgaris]